MAKKIIKITLIVLGALIVIAFAAPFLFKDKLIAIAKKEINKSLNARADFKDLDISFFRHFPRVAAGLEDLQIIGVDDFAKDTLISAKRIDIALDLMSVLRGKDMKIYSVTLDAPRVHVIVTKEGKANWDIMKPDTTTTTSAEEVKPFNLELKKYTINDGYISYVDDTTHMSAEIINLNHSGSGDFTSDFFTLSTKTQAESVSYTYSGIPYLFNSATSVDADIQVDNKQDKYSFKTDNIKVNNLKLAAEGFFQLVNDSTYNMDIKFDAPSTDFKDILSLVPAIYKKDFDKIKTSGSALFNGFVKGTYSPSQIPAYSVNMDVKEGFFQYPDLPKPVQHINLTLKVNNPDGITDNTVVEIPKGHIEMDNEPFDFRLLLKKPVTDQYIDAAAKGRLDLARATQFVKLDAGTKLSGVIHADITAKGNLSAVMQQKPGPFAAQGFLDVKNLAYSSKDFPQPIQNTNLTVRIDNPDGIADHTVVTIPAGHVEVGREPVDFRLLIKNPVSDLYFDGAAKGAFNLANVAQFVAFEPGTRLAGNLNADISFKGNKSAIDKKDYGRIATAGTVAIANLLYASTDYPDGVKLGKLLATFNPKNITINELNGSYKKAVFSANGSINNVFDYVLKDAPLDGVLNVKADQVDVNELMGTSTDTAATGAAAAPFTVPKNIAFVINADVTNAKYDKITIQNLTGKLQLKDETVQLTDVKGQALGGTMTLNGSYSTQASKSKPAMSFNYDVQGLDIQKTFLAFNTVQKLMPIAQFLSGKLSSQLSLSGKLGESMMPDLSTLSGKGALVVLEGVLNRFGPMEKLASTLQVNELQKISLKDIKTYFEFSNGKVLVKPFKLKVKDIDMEIGGIHGLDQTIDYVINMKLPRALLGSQANNLVNNLASQAVAKGIPVKLSDVISLNVGMGGTIKNPSIKLNMKEAGAGIAEDLKKQTADFVQAKADSAKKVLKDTLNAVKNELLKNAKEQLLKQAGGQKDAGDTSAAQPATDPKKRLEEAGKNVLNNLLKKKKPAADTTRKE